jgi:LysR family transcriptional regulator, glycine cleavage system transcriptional activator
LNALRAFESAGRNMSFTRAADELLVTPGAISRQIRTLEDQLGIQLFERNHREVKLTKASEIYVAALTDIFDHIERVTKRVSSESRQDRELHIYSSMTFTLRWLMPRLASFHAENPKQGVRLTAALPTAVDMLAGDIDIAITSFPQADENIVTHKLVDIAFVPVCSPALLDHSGPLRTYDDLRKVTLLRSLARPDAWPRWLEAAEATDIKPKSTIALESSSLCFEAAIKGIGVAMGMKALIADDLATGRLVKPFPYELADGDAFYLVYPRRAETSPQLARFRTWVLAEAAKLQKPAATQIRAVPKAQKKAPRTPLTPA